MKLAFLYAGQGSQKVHMGLDLYNNNEIFRDKIDSLNVDFNFKALMFNGDEKTLSQTRYTQPCLAAFAVGVTEVLKRENIIPQYAAGLSLGEYSALYAAGVFDVQTLMDVVSFRGKEMEKAAQGIECKMSAVLGLESNVLKDICKKVSEREYVTVSNYNCKGQYVICGTEGGVTQAEKLAVEAGAKRCIKLKVSGPFHTGFMKPAGDALKKYFEKIEFGEMTFPVLFNTTASELEENQTIKDILVKQVQSSIYMEDIIKKLDTLGVDTIIEIGPGKTLSGFVKRTSDNIRCYSIEDTESMNRTIDSIRMEAE